MKDDPSRPSSQMSHAASSGYGSARSNAEAASASVASSASQFRSLRLRRDGETAPAVDAAAAAAAGVGVGVDVATLQRTATLPLHSVAEKHEAPVPAPRFQTLKRHAYQNLPLPLKNTDPTNQVRSRVLAPPRRR